MLLYPGEGAIDVASHPPPGPVTLVVVDGTWWQARKVIRANPELSALPRYTFTPPTPSEYRIRKEPDAACVSTIEALVHVLGVLEGDQERFHALLAPFRAMIDAQIAMRRTLPAGAYPPREGPAPSATSPAAELLARGGNLVCVSGEANAWPYGSSERAPSTPRSSCSGLRSGRATGERFELVKAPRHLAPSDPRPSRALQSSPRVGVHRRALRQQWRAFVRDDDVLCSWGTYATTLFAAEGGYLPPVRLDLRQVARAYIQGRFGTLDELLVRLGVAVGPCARRGPRGRATRAARRTDAFPRGGGST